MINENEKTPNQPITAKDDNSKSSDHSLNGFDEGVSDGEFIEETNQEEEPTNENQNQNFEEETKEKIQMRCG